MELVPVKVFDLDRPRILRLSFGTLMRFEEKSGLKFAQCVLLGFSTEAMRDLLWASFVADDKGLKAEDLDELLHAGHINMVGDSIDELLNKSYPEPKKGKQGKNAKSPAG